MGHYFIDSCSFWVSNTTNYIMSHQQIDFTKVDNLILQGGEPLLDDKCYEIFDLMPDPR